MVAIGPLAQVAVLAGLAMTAGLTATGWVTGVVCAVVTDGLFLRGLRRRGATRPGPADVVTWVRAALAGGAAALVVSGTGAIPALVTLAAAALVLDGVD